MKLVNKLCQGLVAGLLLSLPLVASADSLNVTDSAVMRRIVTSPMMAMRMVTTKEEGTLLLSDSPEYPEDNGILSSDQLQGKCRVYFYHVNQSSIPKKIVVMAYNPTDHPLQVSVDRFQYARPNSQYYQVGKELSLLYYEAEPTVNLVTVPAYDYAILGERLNTVAIRPDELFSAIIDTYVPEKMYISSIIMPLSENPFQFVKTIQVLPSDSVHLRGTFSGMNRMMETILPYEPSDGIGVVTLGDGMQDKFLQGTDVLDSTPAENTGNYGVDYTIKLETKGLGRIHMYFNTQGGAYAGVLDLHYGDIRKIVEIPRQAGRYNLGEDDPYGMEYVDSFHAGTNVTVHMMPPGASNLPVRLILVPDKVERQIMSDVAKEKETATATLDKPVEITAPKTTKPHDNTNKKRLLLGDWKS